MDAQGNVLQVSSTASEQSEPNKDPQSIQEALQCILNNQQTLLANQQLLLDNQINIGKDMHDGENAC